MLTLTSKSWLDNNTRHPLHPFSPPPPPHAWGPGKFHKITKRLSSKLFILREWLSISGGEGGIFVEEGGLP